MSLSRMKASKIVIVLCRMRKYLLLKGILMKFCPLRKTVVPEQMLFLRDYLAKTLQM